MSSSGFPAAARLTERTPRAGTRGMPRAERERLLLDLAGSVFASAGYHAASMDEIARLAGVSKPMLYTYFGSKEGLYIAYLERSGHELVGRLAQGFGPTDSPAARLRARVDAFLSFVQERGDGWRVLFSEATSSRPVAEQVAALRARIVEAVARALVSDRPNAGGLEAPAAPAVAHAIVGAGESMANWWLEHPEVPREQVARWYRAVIRGSVVALTASAWR